METLEEIKLLVAKEANCFSWTELISTCQNSLHGLEILNKNINEVSKRYAKQCAEKALKDASESARIIDTEWCPTYGSYGKEIPSNIIVDEQSILQTEIKLP